MARAISSQRTALQLVVFQVPYLASASALVFALVAMRLPAAVAAASSGGADRGTSTFAPAKKRAMQTTTTAPPPQRSTTGAGVSMDRYALFCAALFYLFVFGIIGGFLYLRLRRLRQTNLNASVYDALVSLFAAGSRAAAQNGLYTGAPSTVHITKGSVTAAQGVDPKRNSKRAANNPMAKYTHPQQHQQQYGAGVLDGLARRLAGLLQRGTRVGLGGDGGEARKEKQEDGPGGPPDTVAVPVSQALPSAAATVERREREQTSVGTMREV